MTALALFINMAVQIFFCMMAAGPMIKDMKLDTQEVRMWRETVAHHVATHDPIMKSSLVSRVCSDDGSLNYATMQTDTVHDIYLYQEVYFGEGTPYVGFMLCLAVLFVWFLTMAQEIYVIYRHVIAYYRVDKHWTNSKFMATDGGLSVLHISHARACFIYVILTVRLAFAVSLLYSGGVWLCKTFSVPDLVLNAAALAYIVEIDDIIFKVIVPRGAENLVVNLEPMDLGAPWIWRGLGNRWILLSGSVLYVFLMASMELIPFSEKLDEIMAYMCAGERNFIYDKLDNGTFVWTATPSFYKQRGDSSARKFVAAMIGA
eukprot:gnl/TRDRNA2_/TRDRNA2_122314_c0_seq2.p1 gnl/TRDRNA2_/TRDRNA2_122314_c0~~gnl/TRDRNA2_/TRDRNA2_122314_c0_seq2.p1  ORF type:complete len:336 (-),score=45.51 gnl/TRDRNA2_/TRDRNA2_122314_c0_seq2:131-1081(-)